MVHNGTHPTSHTPKRNFHHHFGGVDPKGLPDFLIDVGLWMPDQEEDNALTECTGYTAADIATDITGVLMSPDFAFAAGLYLDGQPANLDGGSYTASLQALVAFGALPKILAEISATSEGQLFVANWIAWNAKEKTKARANVQNGTYNVLGNGDAFDSILSAVYTNQLGVSIGSPWYREWNDAIAGNGQPRTAIMPPPKDPRDIGGLGWHNYAGKGKKTIVNGQPAIAIKSWQGPNVGDHGWLYFPRETMNAALTVEGSGALTISKNGSRWASLIGILIERFPVLITKLPELLAIGL